MSAIGCDQQAASSKLSFLIRGSNITIQWPRHKTLVEAMIDANLSPAYSCLAGKCGACVCTVLSGEIGLDKNEVLEDADIAEGLVLGCQARPLSDEVEISFD